MSDDPMEDAEILIQQGKLQEAQNLLKTLLATDPHNLHAWAGYLKTCVTDQERIDTLRLCLKYNPENDQVKETLSKLRSLTEQDSFLPSRHDEIMPNKITKKPGSRNFPTTLYSVLYLIGTAGFVAECIYAANLSSSVSKGGGGFGALAVIFILLIVLGPQWILVCMVVPLSIIRRRKQKPATNWILGIGVLTGITFMVIDVVLAISTNNYPFISKNYFDPGPILFDFGLGFISGLGLGTFLLLALDVIKSLIE